MYKFKKRIITTISFTTFGYCYICYIHYYSGCWSYCGDHREAPGYYNHLGRVVRCSRSCSFFYIFSSWNYCSMGCSRNHGLPSSRNSCGGRNSCGICQQLLLVSRWFQSQFSYTVWDRDPLVEVGEFFHMNKMLRVPQQARLGSDSSSLLCNIFDSV